VSLTISLFETRLDVAVGVTQAMQDSVTGMLGNYNGDAMDDLQLPNGTLLDSSLADDDEYIFYNFGKLCKMNMFY